VIELRFAEGPGYRVYLTQFRDVTIVLLAGGDKSSQRKDIAKAQELARLWKEEHDG
jgi:putative addiction module killer protein